MFALRARVHQNRVCCFHSEGQVHQSHVCCFHFGVEASHNHVRCLHSGPRSTKLSLTHACCFHCGVEASQSHPNFISLGCAGSYVDLGYLQQRCNVEASKALHRLVVYRSTHGRWGFFGSASTEASDPESHMF